MKIIQLLQDLHLPITNEEYRFVSKHDTVKITSLDEHDQWIAQNLVRKGVYKINKDDNTLVKKANEKSN